MLVQTRKSASSNSIASRLIPRLLAALALLGISLSALATVKNTMPDYYAEPGLNRFRDPVGVNANELIDPFSGGLSLRHVDVFIPGPGGLDIKVQRVYNSNNVYKSREASNTIGPNPTLLLPRSPVGMGWTLHFGRVVRSGYETNPCDASLTLDNLDNPVLELPDGSQQILFVNGTPFNTTFITRDQWTATCIAPSAGLLVISPEGVKYTMNFRRGGGTTYSGVTDFAWYTTRIEDRNGNWINIAYDAGAVTSGTNAAVLSQITASDGRSVSFTYTDRTDPYRIRLTRISANGQSWDYSYTQVTDYPSPGYWQLTRVSLPAGLEWNYSYHATATNNANSRLLQRVTYPHGATTTYGYIYQCFNATSATNYQCSGGADAYNSIVVRTKANGGRDVAPGTWTYTYSPSTTEDVTTVTFPGGSYVYRHFGSRLAYSANPTNGGSNLWRVGLLRQKDTYNGSTLVNREIYTWSAPYRLSNEQYVRPPYDGSDAAHPRFYDTYVYAPILTRKDIVRDGTTYTTTYSNFVTADGSFNPTTVTETGQASKTTNLTYFPRVAGQNIVRLVANELIAGQPSSKGITRSYDSRGNLIQIVRQGVQEDYGYHTSGDLYRKTNARGFQWLYESYDRGIPQRETHPEGVTITRIVNNTGTVRSETNGRGNTTSYTYDGLNRLTGITRPAGSPVTIAWTSTGRTVTRGAYSQATTFDGFGRPSYINTNGVTQDIAYNALGFKTFESYYSTTAGDSFGVDVLGRMTSIAHADGTSRAIQYLAGNQVRITNERSYPTTFSYRSYGDPDNAADKALMRVDAPEGISTVFARDVIGLPTSVTQGGVSRTYGYNASNFLISEVNPETGTTSYGRDAVGNMTSRQVGSSGITAYTYDGLNRLTLANYPGTTPDVSYQYDANSNLTLVDNGVARRTYSYDANDNLRTETLVTSGLTFTSAYAFNALDQLTSITYPSLRQVSYNPDALGRPTTVTPYLTGVTHHPNGVPATLTHVNGHITTATLTNRQWLGRSYTQRAGTGTATDLSYVYDGLANVTSITNALDAADSKSMTYDGVDRLLAAGGSTVAYDTADNVTSYTTPAGTLSYSYLGNRLNSISGHRNVSFSYDAYGNVTANGTRNFNYDDAGNLRSVGGGTSANYDYDGKNLRVHTNVNGVDRYFFQAADGRLLGEYDNTGTWVKEYAYLGTRLVTTVENIPDVVPSAPASITVPTTSTGTHTISWGAATGTVTRYELQQDTNSGFTAPTLAYSGTALSNSVTVTQDGTYYYRVRACNNTACSAYVIGTNGVAVTLAVPPSVPSSINVPATSSGTHTISWGVATGSVTRYELQQDTSSSFAAPVSVYSGAALGTELTVSQNGTYYYRVRACNGAGCSNYQAGANGVVVTLPTVPPGAPGSISVPISSTTGNFTISWSAGTGTVSHYELQEATENTFTAPIMAYSGTSLSATIGNKPNGTYYYRVRACNGTVCSAYATGSNGVVVARTNQPPVANAGANQAVNEGASVTLTGSGADSDGTIVSYAWVQTTGPAVTLTGANTATASFTAPQVTADTVLTFRLTVTDNDGATGTATTDVTVQNVAAAQPDLVVTSLVSPATNIRRGRILTVRYTVENRGTAAVLLTASGFYLSTDHSTSTSDRLVGVGATGQIAAGASATQDGLLYIPLSVAPGTYYLGAIVDPTNYLGESDETNNTFTGPTVQVQ